MRIDFEIKYMGETVNVYNTASQMVVAFTIYDGNFPNNNSSGGAVDSVNGKTGTVVLGANDISESSTRFWLTDVLKTAYDGAVSAIANMYTKTETDNLLSSKVDKVSGKGLSANDLTDALKSAYDSCVLWISTNSTNLLNHLLNTNNPHLTTAAQVGLGNVNNTSDANKPISTATQTALNLKANTNSVSAIKISSATVTSPVSAVDFILSGYNYYEIRCMSVVAGTSNVGMWVRVSTDSGATFKSGASDYMYQRNIQNGATSAPAMSTADSKITFLGAGISNGATGTYYNAIVKVYDPSNASSYKNINGEFNSYRSDSIYTMGLVNGVYLSNTPINAIRIMLSSGNIASGIFELYGYN